MRLVAAVAGEGKNNLTEAAKDKIGAAAAPKKSPPELLLPVFDFDTSDDEEVDKINTLPPKHFSQATKCPVGSGTVNEYTRRLKQRKVTEKAAGNVQLLLCL